MFYLLTYLLTAAEGATANCDCALEQTCGDHCKAKVEANKHVHVGLFRRYPQLACRPRYRPNRRINNYNNLNMCLTQRSKHILAFVEEYINTLENIVIASCCCELHILRHNASPRVSSHLLSAGDFAQSASDVCERWTLFSSLVPAAPDQIDQRPSKFRCLRQHRSVWDALAVTYTVHNVCNDNNDTPEIQA